MECAGGAGGIPEKRRINRRQRLGPCPSAAPSPLPPPPLREPAHCGFIYPHRARVPPKCRIGFPLFFLCKRRFAEPFPWVWRIFCQAGVGLLVRTGTRPNRGAARPKSVVEGTGGNLSTGKVGLHPPGSPAGARIRGVFLSPPVSCRSRPRNPRLPDNSPRCLRRS